jgi:7-cyano-7-deazaguanine synthase
MTESMKGLSKRGEGALQAIASQKQTEDLTPCKTIGLSVYSANPRQAAHAPEQALHLFRPQSVCYPLRQGLPAPRRQATIRISFSAFFVAMNTLAITPMPPRAHSAALVLFSGGQDSTTCLAQALSKYERVETIAFDYGQRHKVELQARLNVLREIKTLFPHWAAKLGQDHLLDLAVLGQVSESSLTRDRAFKMESSGLPNTFVPGRNLLFLTLAAALAYRRDLQVLVTGVCETDFSGYPDCRDDTMKAMQLALSLGMDKRFLIETPLMWIDKSETWGLAQALGGRPLVELIIEHTHTCYLGDREHRHAWGYGCGQCPACELRARGYAHYAAANDQA